MAPPLIGPQTMSGIEHEVRLRWGPSSRAWTSDGPRCRCAHRDGGERMPNQLARKPAGPERRWLVRHRSVGADHFSVGCGPRACRTGENAQSLTEPREVCRMVELLPVRRDARRWTVSAAWGTAFALCPPMARRRLTGTQITRGTVEAYRSRPPVR
jgi:hypothetical protein